MNEEVEPDFKVVAQAPKNGLFCFLNTDRECGADCMAYLPAPSESQSLSEQQKYCTILVGIERLGRHTGIITQTLKKMQESAVDQKRTATSPLSPKGPGR